MAVLQRAALQLDQAAAVAADHPVPSVVLTLIIQRFRRMGAVGRHLTVTVVAASVIIIIRACFRSPQDGLFTLIALVGCIMRSIPVGRISITGEVIHLVFTFHHSTTYGALTIAAFMARSHILFIAAPGAHLGMRSISVGHGGVRIVVHTIVARAFRKCIAAVFTCSRSGSGMAFPDIPMVQAAANIAGLDMHPVSDALENILAQIMTAIKVVHIIRSLNTEGAYAIFQIAIFRGVDGLVTFVANHTVGSIVIAEIRILLILVGADGFFCLAIKADATAEIAFLHIDGCLAVIADRSMGAVAPILVDKAAVIARLFRQRITTMSTFIVIIVFAGITIIDIATIRAIAGMRTVAIAVIAFIVVIIFIPMDTRQKLAAVYADAAAVFVTDKKAGINAQISTAGLAQDIVVIIPVGDVYFPIAVIADGPCAGGCRQHEKCQRKRQRQQQSQIFFHHSLSPFLSFEKKQFFLI